MQEESQQVKNCRTSEKQKDAYLNGLQLTFFHILHFFVAKVSFNSDVKITGSHISMLRWIKRSPGRLAVFISKLNTLSFNNLFSFGAALSRADLRRGCLFHIKRFATLPLTDCKRRFIPRPTTALQSVIVIQRWGKSCHHVRVDFEEGWGVVEGLPALFYQFQLSVSKRILLVSMWKDEEVKVSLQKDPKTCHQTLQTQTADWVTSSSF